MKKYIGMFFASLFLLGIADVLRPDGQSALATAYNQVIRIVDASGNILGGVASATTASANLTVQVVDANGNVLNGFTNGLSPSTFGAKGDARMATAYDVNITSGQATLTSASLAPVTADAGKSIVVWGAGADGILQGVGATGTINRATGAGSVTFTTAPTNLQVINSVERKGTVFATDSVGTGNGSTTTFTWTASQTPTDSQALRVDSVTGHSGGDVAAVDVGPTDLVTTITSVSSGTATLNANASSSLAAAGDGFSSLVGKAAIGTDDTTALQNWITAGQNAAQNCKEGSANSICNVVLTCPAKQFMVTGTLTIDASNVVLDCSAASFIVANTTATPWLTIGDASNHKRDVTIKLGHVYGNITTNTQTEGIQVINMEQVHISTTIERFVLGVEIGAASGSVNQYIDLSGTLARFSVLPIFFHRCDYCGGSGFGAETFWDRGMIVGGNGNGVSDNTNGFAVSRFTTDTSYGSANFGVDLNAANGGSYQGYCEIGVGTSFTVPAQCMRLAGANTNGGINGMLISGSQFSDTSHTYTGTPASPLDAIVMNIGNVKGLVSKGNMFGTATTTGWANAYTAASTVTASELGPDNLGQATGTECSSNGTAMYIIAGMHIGACFKTNPILLDSPTGYVEGSAPSAVASQDFIWGDSTAHRLKANANNGTTTTILTGLPGNGQAAVWSGTTANIAATTKDYLAFGQTAGLAVIGTQANAQNGWPFAGTLSNLQCKVTTAAGATGDTFAIEKNGSATGAPTCTVGNGTTTCNDTSTQLAVAANDLLDIVVNSAATNTNATGVATCSFMVNG